MFKSKKLKDIILIGSERSGMSTSNLMFIKRDLFSIHKDFDISEEKIFQAIKCGLNMQFGIYKFSVQNICVWIREVDENSFINESKPF